MKTIFLSAILVMCSTISLSAAGLTGRDVMLKAKNRPDGDTRYATLTMTLIQKNGNRRERKLVSWAMDVGKDSKRVMFFTYPGDVKGTGFLTWDYDNAKREDDRWLYLPAMKKTRRISGKSSKTDYFMGSDFTYDDMSSRNVDEETHTLLREEMIGGQKCWVVQSVPNDKHEIYSKRITWIRQDCAMAVKAEYYDKLDKLHRSLTVSNISKVQGFWVMGHMEMTNVQTGHKTILQMSGHKFDLKIDAALFTVARLEKGI
ncbi:hypothetical protein HMPREF9151_01036 [Hoylesella saccharolytica F0055]|uniref:Uncharacterized protein TP-0789 domain-containing protein n=1 Tax=Hoylesella saccharolytica F0055 TaxID=1127699 RepID=L1ND51_9BACT|nr:MULTISPECIES: outer membrane lipoprotein-sorting protein [Hoylesella]EKY01424.1 hypothetical protein HMPREF9151_01036 [Hoylesella saccharolytica F0055]